MIFHHHPVHLRIGHAGRLSFHLRLGQLRRQTVEKPLPLLRRPFVGVQICSGNFSRDELLALALVVFAELPKGN